MIFNSIIDGKKTKLQSTIEVIEQSISMEQFKIGDALPSVNILSKELGVSRDTAFKAYKELKRRGAIDSTPTKGYYVLGNNIRILLFLDLYSPFKELLYNSLQKNLPENHRIDLAFHHYNKEVFELVVDSSFGKYNFYLVMNFDNKKLHSKLKNIDPGKLLLLDFADFDTDKYSYIRQDFAENPYQCLMDEKERIAKYNKIVFYSPIDNEHPVKTVEYLKKLAKEIHQSFERVHWLENRLQLDSLYICTRQKDLVELLKKAKDQNLICGQDYGIIVYNDNPMYEFIENGITAISVDFAQMGILASEFIKTRKKISETIPTKLILRGSL